MTKSSTGGTIVQVGKSTFHYAGEGVYSGRLAEENVNPVSVDQPKRGRGRPRKDGGVGTGPRYDFTGLVLSLHQRVPASMKRLSGRVVSFK